MKIYLLHLGVFYSTHHGSQWPGSVWVVQQRSVCLHRGPLCVCYLPLWSAVASSFHTPLLSLPLLCFTQNFTQGFAVLRHMKGRGRWSLIHSIQFYGIWLFTTKTSCQQSQQHSWHRVGTGEKKVFSLHKACPVPGFLISDPCTHADLLLLLQRQPSVSSRLAQAALPCCSLLSLCLCRHFLPFSLSTPGGAGWSEPLLFLWLSHPHQHLSLS